MFGLVAMLILGGCSGEEVAPPAPEPAPAPAPEPAPAPAPAAGEVMTVDAVNAARAEQVGKVVSVKGFYTNFTKQGGDPGQINVPVRMSEDPAAKGEVLCIMDLSKEEEIKAVANNSEITVTGKVSDKTFFDNAMLDECVLGAPAGDAPAGDAPPKEGKAGKGGKTGKGGKAKAH